MKHNSTVTTILVLLFVASQLLGLALVAKVTPLDQVAPTTGEAAQRGGSLLLGVLIGTALLLVIIKFKLLRVWKFWYFLAVFFAMTFALEALIPSLIAALIAFGLALWKVKRPNVIVHNLTEILVYAGIAVLIASGFNLTPLIAAGLLVLIALYDAYAVWKSKHMVKMAEFQTQSKLFAGLLVPYGKDKSIAMPKGKTKTAPKKETAEGRTAVLGGGDIAFPLIFSATVLQALIRQGLGRQEAFMYTLPIVAAGALTLLGLFILAKKDRFYPAMPFLTAGTFIGYAVVLLIV